MNNQETQDLFRKIKNKGAEMKKAHEVPEVDRCKWPQCTEQYMHILGLQAFRKFETTVEAEIGKHINVGFCQYHFLIAGNGQFGVTIVSEEPLQMQLRGPFEYVAVCEAVMGAREATKRDQPATIEEIHAEKKS